MTTRDATGKAHGYTATAFSAVSLDPPLILSCLSRSASCFPVFAAAKSFCVNVLSTDDEGLARHFATKMADKFLAHDFAPGYCEMPSVTSALAVFGCDVETAHPAGDHVVIIGRVRAVTLTQGNPLLYYRRKFQGLPASTDGARTPATPAHAS
ncbi:flavin reductase family protein [Frankia sp. CN7]|nr:flavin reductase family protein [Frankia nepalensis]